MRIVVVICVIAASAFVGSPLWAGLGHVHDLDQYTGFPDNEAVPNYGYAVGNTNMMAQTFTVGLPGLLCHVEIGNTTPYVSWDDPSRPVVEIWSTTADGRPGSIIRGASVPLPDPVPVDGWTPLIDFTAYNIQVNPGEKYAIVLSAFNPDGAVSVGGTDYESYERGDLWATDDAGTWQFLWDVDPLKQWPVYDMQFRTYVVPVPLPAGVWLGIFAVSVAGWHLKRQMA